MMRDIVMNEQYFSEYIQEELQRVKKFMDKLEKNEVREDRVYSVKKKIDSIKFGLLIAKYSYGEDIRILEPEFLQLLNDMPMYWKKESSYVDMVWMMSLAILFDVNEEKFCVLSDLVRQYNYEDALLDFFIKYKEQGVIEKIEGDFIYGFPYDKLGIVVTDNNYAEERLKEYLEKNWYSGHKEMSWYDIHKAKEKLYYGYWSFEAGAIAKILNINDENLKNTPYYPYDLVHYNS